MNTSTPAFRLPRLPLLPAVALALVLVGSYALAAIATPKVVSTGTPVSLEAGVARNFGAWREIPSNVAQVGVSTNTTDRNMDQPYDQLLMRTYRHESGRMVHVAVAWGESQRQEVKIHRPELCYPAQGFKVLSLSDTSFPGLRGPYGAVTGKRMLARTGGHHEAVVYWIRIGSVFSDSAWETRGHIVREGLQGRVPDGILVRVSTPTDADPASLESNFQMLEQFATELAQASPSAPVVASTASLRAAASR